MEKFSSHSHTNITEEMIDTLAKEHERVSMIKENEKEGSKSIDSKRVSHISVGNTRPSDLSEKVIKVEEGNDNGRESARTEEFNPEEKKRLLIVSIITGVALSIHNFPEGIATFTACSIILIY